MDDFSILLGLASDFEKRKHELYNGIRTPKRKRRRNSKYLAGWYIQKKKVLIRDNHTCQKCGGKWKLHVHHIDCDKSNDSLDNLITLCPNCHLSSGLHH